MLGCVDIVLQFIIFNFEKCPTRIENYYHMRGISDVSVQKKLTATS